MKLAVINFLPVLLFILFISYAVSAKQGSSLEFADRYAKTAHIAFENRDFLKAGEFYEKAYNAGKIKVYFENSITAYLHYAFDCSNEKKYDQAIKYCEKVLLMSPDNREAKETLSDTYYTRGSDSYYREFIEKAEKDIKKSLEFAVLPEQKEQAEEMLYKISGRKGSISTESANKLLK